MWKTLASLTLTNATTLDKERALDGEEHCNSKID